MPMLWLGSTVLSYLMTVIGRKYTVLLAILPVIYANIALAFATSFATLAVGQFFLAIGGAGTLIGGHLIGEFSSPRLRGLLLSLRNPCMATGFIAVHSFGALSISWRTISLIATVPMILAFLIIVSCPESAVWLAAKGKIDKCRTSYNWYRGDQEQKELEDMIRNQANDVQLKETKFKNFTEVKTYLLDRKFLRALGICIACSFIIDCSGKQLFTSMSVDITSRILGHELSSNELYYLVALDLAEFITSIVVCFVVKKFQRRTLMFIMTPVALAFLFIFCLSSFLKSRGLLSESYSWVSFLFLMIYFILQAPSFTIAYTLIYEVYPYSHKSIAIMFQNAFLCLILFIFLNFAPGWLNDYGAHGTFLMYGLVMIGSVIILYYMLPETSDKTLLNIEREMQGNEVTSQDREQEKPLNLSNNETVQA